MIGCLDNFNYYALISSAERPNSEEVLRIVFCNPVSSLNQAEEFECEQNGRRLFAMKSYFDLPYVLTIQPFFSPSECAVTNLDTNESILIDFGFNLVCARTIRDTLHVVIEKESEGFALELSISSRSKSMFDQAVDPLKVASFNENNSADMVGWC